MLSCQITDLTSSGELGVTRVDLSTLVGVQVSQSTVAVSVGGDGLVVNMVGVWASGSLEAFEVDGDLDAGSVTGAREFDRTSNSAVGGEGSNIARWKREKRLAIYRIDSGMRKLVTLHQLGYQ